MRSPTGRLTTGVSPGAFVDTLVSGFLALVKGDCLGIFGSVGLLAVAADARVDKILLSRNWLGTDGL